MRPSIVVSRGAAAPRRERGVVLFVALIVLIVMTLAGLALLRQMTTGVSIAGNIAFKENATSVADRGAEVALQYLGLPTTVSALDSLPDGYHSSWAGATNPADPTNPTLFDWTQSLLLVSPDQAQTGNTARVMIHRLCLLPNQGISAAGQTCSDAPVLNSGASTGGGGYGPGGVLPPVTPTPFYRITTQVLGPRNTVSYTQVLLQ
jgi:type IV pilus assembly protein PilX